MSQALTLMPGYYIQDEPGQPLAIHLSLDALDMMGRAVMTGFGRVPRRGAEIGGILLGRLLPGDRPAIRIDDFRPVPIEYRFGPAYRLSEDDEHAFASAVAESGTGENRAVGFMRSSTREDKGLTSADISLLEKYFAGRPFTVLLVRPFASRPSVASFFTCTEGPFAPGMPGGPEFPFRKRELVPAAAAAAAGGITRPHWPATEVEGHPPAAVPLAPARPMPDTRPAANLSVAEPAMRPATRSAWTWLPFSFIFLLLGILLGFEAAGAFRNTPLPPDPYDLRLAITKSGTNLTVKWDHASNAVRTAQRGSLSISDGLQQRTIDLGATELTSGSIVYAPSSPLVHFRLEVFPKESSSLTQTVDWKQ